MPFLALRGHFFARSSEADAIDQAASVAVWTRPAQSIAALGRPGSLHTQTIRIVRVLLWPKRAPHRPIVEVLW